MAKGSWPALRDLGEHHRVEHAFPGDRRKATGASEGDRSQTLPRSRLGTSNNPGNAQALTEIELAAGPFGVKLQYVDILSPKDIETAFRAAGKGRADAVLMPVAGPISTFRRPQIAELAVKSRLPAIYDRRESVEAGGLMTTV